MTAKKASSRSKRVPLGVPRLRMSVTERPGYKRRWINDKAGRLNDALSGGYNFVKKDEADFVEPDAANRNEALADAVCKTVNSDGTKAYLMEISTPMYVSDQRAKQTKINELEDGLKQGNDTHGKTGTDGRYVPEEGIKIA
jgi:uncharacterized membrane-anchored protein